MTSAATMTQGRNPTRRNRNIGTAKQGRGQDNELVIPESWWDPYVFWQKLGLHNVVSRKIGNRHFRFLIEQTRDDCIYPCTPDDVALVLGQIPPSDLGKLELIVWRQPKRKERILSPVWGRLTYQGDFGRFSGAAVILEALDLRIPVRWSRSLHPEKTDELNRLRADGHEIENTKREYVIHSDLNSVRNTQLYRTLLHEVGHWVDWLEKVEHPLARGTTDNRNELEELYFNRPKGERERFAHSYADRTLARLVQERVLPFNRILDVQGLKRDGLRHEDFTPANSD